MAKPSKLTKARQMWKHLREWKKYFWNTERENVKREIKKDLDGK